MRAVANIFPDPTSAFTVAPLVARKVERLVGSHFHWLFLASHSQIVSARSMDFPLRVGEGSLAVQLPLFPDPTSRVRGPDTLWRVPWTRLFDAVCFFRLLNHYSVFLDRNDKVDGADEALE